MGAESSLTGCEARCTLRRKDEQGIKADQRRRQKGCEKLLVKSRYEEIDPERSLSLDLFDLVCSMLMRGTSRHLGELIVAVMSKLKVSREGMKSTRCKGKRHRIAFGNANV